MRKLLLIAPVMFLLGCATPDSPVKGAWYTDVEGPIGASGQPTGSQKGTACASSILGLIATGDASIMAAARAGRIATISHVDHSSFGILGLYGKYCTNVYGKGAGGAAAKGAAPAPAPAPSPAD